MCSGRGRGIAIDAGVDTGIYLMNDSRIGYGCDSDVGADDGSLHDSILSIVASGAGWVHTRFASTCMIHGKSVLKADVDATLFAAIGVRKGQLFAAALCWAAGFAMDFVVVAWVAIGFCVPAVNMTKGMPPWLKHMV